jgi:ActR/RegA family two-component response regulator
MASDRRRCPRGVEGTPYPTVIIVDREPLYRWFVSQSLDERGLHVVQCRTLGEAAACLRRMAADLLLIDGQTIQDEGVDAMELLQRVARSVRCVVLDSTSPGYTNDDVGDAALVDKPVDPTAIVELLDRQLHRPALPA